MLCQGINGRKCVYGTFPDPDERLWRKFLLGQKNDERAQETVTETQQSGNVLIKREKNFQLETNFAQCCLSGVLEWTSSYRTATTLTLSSAEVPTSACRDCSPRNQSYTLEMQIGGATPSRAA